MNRVDAPRQRRLPRLRATTGAWLALLALTGLSVAAAGHAHQGGSRLAMTALVALIAATKAGLLARHYLEVHQASPVFRWVVGLFSALVPVALVISGLREWMI